MKTNSHKSGYVALIGRPNAGKSTLLNSILGSKLVAVTPHPQTTRNRIFGIYDREDVQIVFQDTPGLLDPKDAMHEFMVREAERALADADAAVWLIDAIKGVTPRENIIADNMLTKLKIPLLVAINKIDKIKKNQLIEQMDTIRKIPFDPIPPVHPVSALFGEGVERLLQNICSFLPQGPKFFPPDQLSDRAQRFFVAELIREKAFLLLRQELPYSLAVQIETMKERDDGVTAIQAVLYVERDSQKGILVGKKGAMIKQIGTEARKDVEKMLEGKVFLELWVKVSPKWRKNRERLKEFGYAEP
ncbi:MAG: GTPase Era [Candidatus Omnitrophota bacterium]|jgi:GTP-binding protein Era|nr:MAG: GTPase Era [Candidatus Omnitrophota bacterium]